MTQRNLITYPSLIILFFTALLLPANSINAKIDASLTARLKGKILLQVESKGEAWYINPKDSKKYSLGKPTDAFELMKKLGVGISNVDISKIPVADASSSGEDTDGDGLSDAIENAIGTDKLKADTDGDGYTDKNELISGHDPVRISIKLPTDINFAAKQKGKILIQVQQRGEAWYVNPSDGKRHFLGRPSDAFNVMRGLAIGITNANLAKVGYTEITQKDAAAPAELKDCGEDEECFLRAVSYGKCDPTRLVKDAEFNLLSVGKQKESTLYELRGVKNGQCILYAKTTALEIKYSEYMKGELTAVGHASEELVRRETEANARLQDLLGRDGSCQINPIRELNNSYSSGVRDVIHYTTTAIDKGTGPYKCSGAYFEPIRQKSICNVLTGFTGAPAKGYHTDYKAFKFGDMDQNQNLTFQVGDISDTIGYLATKTINGLVVKNLGWTQVGGASGARFIKVEFNCD